MPVHGASPKSEEVFEGGQSHIETVEEAIEEKEYEELVVVEGNTVIDPGTVVIHLEHARTAHRTVVRAVRLDVRALFTISHSSLYIR